MTTPPSAEGFAREQRLRRSVDYLRCYRRGGKKHGSLVSLHFHSNDESHARLGITASRKVGKAVVRHRCKRRVREIWRRWPRQEELCSLDVVVHLKPTCASASFEELNRELVRLLGIVVKRRRDRSPKRRHEPAE